MATTRYYATVAANDDNAYMGAYHITATNLRAALRIAEERCRRDYANARIADISEEG